MGPTNVALVKVFKAEKALREAQANLDNASRDMVVQENRIRELTENLNLTQARLREQQTQARALELDVSTVDGHIERLRRQQQMSRTEKEYRAFVLEINTQKAEKRNLEDALLEVMSAVEKLQKEEADLKAQLAAAQQRCEQIKEQLAGRLSELRAVVDAARAVRDAALAEVPLTAREMFVRLCDKFEGEAMAAIGMPDKRREEYVCTACNMSLVVDIYNRLHASDEPVVCPNCRRMLYIPDDLPPQVAIGGGRQKKTPGSRKPRASRKSEAPSPAPQGGTSPAPDSAGNTAG